MLTCLSALTRLETLEIGFESSRSHPDRESRPPPLTHTLLPALTRLHFKGASEYLEDLVAGIGAPLLNKMDITFFRQSILDTPQLTQLISRTPNFKAQERARVVFDSDWDVWITLPQTFDGELCLGISGRQPDWQLSSLAQVCRSSFPRALILAVGRLYMLGGRMLRVLQQDTIESSRWMELLRPFTAVKYLYISQEFGVCIAPSLQELVGGRTMEVLPALETLFLEGPSEPIRVQEAIGQFSDARRLSGHPIAVSRWESEEDVWGDS